MLRWVISGVITGGTLLLLVHLRDSRGPRVGSNRKTDVTVSSHLRPLMSVPAAPPVEGVRRELRASGTPVVANEPVADDRWLAPMSDNLSGSRVFELRVVTIQGERPVPGATVTLHHHEGSAWYDRLPAALFSGVTDRNGSLWFRYRPVNATVQIRVLAPGHATRLVHLWLNRPRARLVAMDTGRPLEVLVLEPDGTPHADAGLELSSLNNARSPGPGFIPDWVGRTDSKGRYTFTGVACDAPFVVTVSLKGSTELQSLPTYIPEHRDRHELEIVLPERRDLAGRLVNHGGRDLEGFWISIRPRISGWQYQGSAESTDEDGSFRFVEVPVGDYDLLVESYDRVEARRGVTVHGGDPGVPIEIEIADAWSFAGLLVLEDPLNNAPTLPAPEGLVLRSPRTGEVVETDFDADGYCFAFDLVEPVYQVELEVETRSHYRLLSPLQVTATNSELFVHLETGGVIVSGEPGAIPDGDDDLVVLVFRDGRLVWSEEPDAAFQSPPLAAGEFTILACSNRSTVREYGPLQRNVGEPIDLGRLDLVPAPLLRGIVQDRDGRPLPEVEVDHYLSHTDAEEHDLKNWTETGPDGCFEFAAAPGGLLVFYHPDHASLVCERDALQGTDVRVTLERGATVHGQVASNGVGLQRLPVWLERQDDPADLFQEIEAVTNESGCFRFLHVTPGEYELVIADGDGGEMPRRRVEVGRHDVHLAPILLQEWIRSP